MFIDIIGWFGTLIMLAGSIFSIYKHILCWPAWIAGGACIIIQGITLGTWNIVALQLLYIPIDLIGWYQWRKDDSENILTKENNYNL